MTKKKEKKAGKHMKKSELAEQLMTWMQWTKTKESTDHVYKRESYDTSK